MSLRNWLSNRAFAKHGPQRIDAMSSRGATASLRGGVGFAVDYGTLYLIDPAWIYRGDQSWGLGVLNAVDQRANIDFRYYSTGSPFEYETIRFLYVRRRLIEDAGLHARDRPKPPPADAPAGK